MESLKPMSFWEEFADEMYGGTRVPRVPGIARYVYDRLGLGPGSIVYDIGAGRGHVSVELAMRGCSMRAVDLVPSFGHGLQSMVDRLRLPIAVVVADVRDLETMGDACAALLLWNVLGSASELTDVAILAQTRKLVHANGSLAIELTTSEDLKGTTERTCERTLLDGETFARTWQLDRSGVVQHVEWAVRDATGRAVRYARFSRRVYSRKQVCELLRSVDWSPVLVEYEAVADFEPTGTMFVATASARTGAKAGICCRPSRHSLAERKTLPEISGL